MRKERKVNIIRALKDELDFYKRQTVPVNFVYKTDLEHLKISGVFSPNEIISMSKEVLSKLIIQRLSLMELPIVTEFEEKFGVYRASLDLWVKPKGF